MCFQGEFIPDMEPARPSIPEPQRPALRQQVHGDRLVAKPTWLLALLTGLLIVATVSGAFMMRHDINELSDELEQNRREINKLQLAVAGLTRAQQAIVRQRFDEEYDHWKEEFLALRANGIAADPTGVTRCWEKFWSLQERQFCAFLEGQVTERDMREWLDARRANASDRAREVGGTHMCDSWDGHKRRRQREGRMSEFIGVMDSALRGDVSIAMKTAIALRGSV